MPHHEEIPPVGLYDLVELLQTAGAVGRGERGEVIVLVGDDALVRLGTRAQPSTVEAPLEHLRVIRRRRRSRFIHEPEDGMLTFPTTAHELLRILDVSDASRRMQQGALAEWLRHNRPPSPLRESLEREGLLGD